MKHQSELERSARENLKAGKYLGALEDLDQLTAIKRDLAIKLYETYRSDMYTQLRKWGGDVIRRSRDHLLLAPDLFEGDFSEEMTEFEKDYGVESVPKLIPSKLHEAQKIVADERRVRPQNLTPKIIDEIEKHLFENLFSHKKLESLPSHSEKIRYLRKNYRTNPEPLANLLRLAHNFVIDIRNIHI